MYTIRPDLTVAPEVISLYGVDVLVAGLRCRPSVLDVLTNGNDIIVVSKPYPVADGDDKPIPMRIADSIADLWAFLPQGEFLISDDEDGVVVIVDIDNNGVTTKSSGSATGLS